MTFWYTRVLPNIKIQLRIGCCTCNKIVDEGALPIMITFPGYNGYSSPP